jgi:hypothetical protein
MNSGLSKKKMIRGSLIQLIDLIKFESLDSRRLVRTAKSTNGSVSWRQPWRRTMSIQLIVHRVVMVSPYVGCHVASHLQGESNCPVGFTIPYHLQRYGYFHLLVYIISCIRFIGIDECGIYNFRFDGGNLLILTNMGDTPAHYTIPGILLWKSLNHQLICDTKLCPRLITS